MSTYLLGVVTLPAALGVLWVILRLGFIAADRLEARGWTVEVKTDRKPDEIPTRVLRREIWFERQRGPIFTGHWYRERGDETLATRWLGAGSSHGRSIMIFHKRTIAADKTAVAA